MSKKNDKDQYYTNKKYALECYEVVRNLVDLRDRLLVECCAGTGAFFNLMPEKNRLGLDLDPKCEGPGMIQESQDFLKYEKSLDRSVVISNPPFGKNSSLAISFFNHCAFLGAEVIAFVVPKTFKKASVQNKLDTRYKLVFEKDSPKNAFILDEEEYDVPCCFQVWKKPVFHREPINTSSRCDYFSFVLKESNPDLAVRRVGGRAGQLLEGLDHKEPSTYFLKVKEGYSVEEIAEAIKNADLTEIASNTAGMRSVAKYELVNKVTEYLISK